MEKVLERIHKKYIYKNIDYKSYGEFLIAQYLDYKNINFTYEKQIDVIDKEDMERLWYPDFYLNDLDIIIEYFGMRGNKNYDKGIIIKKKTYKKNGYDIIPVYKETLNKNWKKYLMIEITKLSNDTISKDKLLKQEEIIKNEHIYENSTKTIFQENKKLKENNRIIIKELLKENLIEKEKIINMGIKHKTIKNIKKDLNKKVANRTFIGLEFILLVLSINISPIIIIPMIFIAFIYYLFIK